MTGEAHGLGHRVGPDGILRLVFDLPGERVNLLNAALLEELDRLLEQARTREDVRAVLFMSAKPGMFLAGMDVDEIGAVTDAYRAAEGARRGQAVLSKIAELRKPTAAAINGTCLGGGTELVLACDLRLAAADPAVSIGLPEVKLGIIPGFGGTQRMPRLIGLRQSLPLIASGRTLRAAQARSIGLVDRVVPAVYLEREAAVLLAQAIRDGVESTVAAVRKRPPFLTRLTDRLAPLRKFMLDQARQQTAKKVKPEHYPAPFRSFESIEAAFTQPINVGLDTEARIIGELIPTRTSKNLIWLFKAQTAMKSENGGIQATPRRVRRMAVIGAGIMGGGIAQLAADRGIGVRLLDLKQEPILTALQTARGIWDYKLKRKRLSRRELEQKMAFISPTTDGSGIARADLVLEAVVENLEIKRQVLADVEGKVDARAVFATNTSSLPIEEIAARARHPERVVGMHFFNPVHRMPLVEIIASKLSSTEALATVHQLATRMGKVPVLVKDGPGFLVNRILGMYLNETLQLFSEGLRIDAIDRAMVAYGMPMGPFALMDQVGLDTARHVGEVLREAFGERVGATDAVLEAMVASGRQGKKNEQGFYRYRRGKATMPDTGCYALVGDPTPKELSPETLQERLVLAMVNEAAICLQERVAGSPRDVDMAMVLGTGFPPFRGGLLRQADAVGIPIISDRLSRLADAQGARFRPAELWGMMVREQHTFYGESAD